MEFVHHMQNEKGELTHDGYMGQGYAQKNPQMREMERQAYEMGNLCFRDWEDSLKEKHPTIYNERRDRTMSLKNWKNKELNENLSEKWGFNMNLNEMANHMSDDEQAYAKCMEMHMSQGMSVDEAKYACIRAFCLKRVSTNERVETSVIV